MKRAALCLLVCLVTSSLAAQEDDEENPFRPGIVATYSQKANVVRVEPSVSLAWEQVPPDARFAPGALSARWQGRLLTQGKATYRLHVYLEGKAQVDLGTKRVLKAEAEGPQWFTTEPLELEHDYHPLTIQYTSSSDRKRLRLFWSSENFSLEPVPAKQLFHEPGDRSRIHNLYERGRDVVQSQRCAACHELPGEAAPLASPALDRVKGNLPPAWLQNLLDADHYGSAHVSAEEAADLVQYLTEQQPVEHPRVPPGDAAAGKRLFHTVGCLACHTIGEHGTAGLFAGGDLSDIGHKRSATYLTAWLKSPAELNRHHRMPVFDLTEVERQALATYLAEQTTAKPPLENTKPGDAERGKELLTSKRCTSCHTIRGGEVAEKLPAPREPKCKFVQASDALLASESQAIAAYLAPSTSRQQSTPAIDGGRLLAERNCLACHAREGAEGLAPKLLSLAKANADLAPLVPALTPPSLLAVGDKLHDTTLLANIKRMEQPHRDYLQVRMPRFDFTQDELEALLAHFVAYDRIPPQSPDERLHSPQNLPKEKELEEAGKKLVVSGTGFACTSCHAIGKFKPSKAPINARGPNLSNVNFRIREPYFYRWCKNPARIVPGQEMPSVSVPAKGILKENLIHQLAAVWTILNTPGFEPKDAGPVRVVHSQNIAADFVVADDVRYLDAMTIGLWNRHNILYDLQSGRVVRWWTGDCMSQHTEGKTWHWRIMGNDLLQAGFDGPELSLLIDGEELRPVPVNDRICELSGWDMAHDVTPWFQCKMTFAGKKREPITVQVRHEFAKDGPFPDDDKTSGWQHFVRINGLPVGAMIRLRVLGPERVQKVRSEKERPDLLKLDNLTLRAINAAAGDGFVGGFERLSWENDGSLLSKPADKDGKTGLSVLYHSQVKQENLAPHEAARDLDSPFLAEARGFTFEWLSLADASSSSDDALDPAEIEARQPVPGLSAYRLKIPPDLLMPTAFAWQPKGDLLVTSLKGATFAFDGFNKSTDYNRWEQINELAAPYGVAGRGERSFDVLHKKALVRVTGSRHLIAAAGWGYTEDYHDWAVGLVGDGADGYYMALPCQQDKRSEAAARFRGNVLRLTPRKATPENLKLFDIQPVSSGHRFPMGIAKNRTGDVFVTDNQGNYNPFNELNHVQKGKHFGFVNAIDKNKPKPPTTPPAINIPHPWTRSVNGICFLETPEPLREKEKDLWGPFEGHLVGCEYDTRRLIRMSLQKVGDTYQGACYPFSLEKPKGENFLGPISCAISPRGELYVGSIRDSGWGGGANVGEIVRIDPPRDQALPAGIAEITANKDGFAITFTQPVDAALAGDANSYAIESFTRESTPAYGGPDKDRRLEKLRSVKLSDDRRSVQLSLEALRTGFVYEFHIKNLVGKDQMFFPAEAYYTLNAIPQK